MIGRYHFHMHCLTTGVVPADLTILYLHFLFTNITVLFYHLGESAGPTCVFPRPTVGGSQFYDEMYMSEVPVLR